MSKDDRISGNAFTRGARLAGLPAAYAARTTVGLGRRIVGAPAQAVMNDVQKRTAEQMFSVLGQLKGGAMKFGQALSVFEAALPEEFAGPYREALAKLQDAAPSMPTATVHRVMATEFGSDWRTRFIEFDEVPAAAASIGQVHRATWLDHDGEPRDVAVKIQYPGAGKALLSDLKQIGRLAKLIGVVAPGLDLDGIVTELRARVAEELDYRLEATAQNIFADAFADDTDIVIPRCLHHTERGLVSEWMESTGSLGDIIKTGTPEERDHYGEVFVRFLFAGPERAGLLHADPHPGNFRIIGDGRLGVVDFGAVARVPEGLPPAIGPLLRAAVDRDYDAVFDGLADEGFFRVGADIDREAMATYLDPLIEPARQETFAFSRSWLRDQAQRMAARAPEGIGTATKLTVPPEYVLIHRVWTGGVGVLCQLESTAPFRSIVEASLPGFGDDLED